MRLPPNEIAGANAGLRLRFAEKSLVVPSLSPGVARLRRWARAFWDDMKVYQKLVGAWVASLLSLTPMLVRGVEPAVTSTNEVSRNELGQFVRLESSTSVTGHCLVTVVKNPPGGVGLLIGQAADRVYVRQVVAGTPAWNAGVREGDVITGIGSQATVGMRLREVAMLLRGEVGSEVDLTLARAFPARTFKVTLRREVVKPPGSGFHL